MGLMYLLCRFNQAVMLRIMNNYIMNHYDFFYLPLDFDTEYNLGYCYINVIDRQTVKIIYDNVLDCPIANS